jgi:hypothetical protein
MLNVRLPAAQENALIDYCRRHGLTKTQAVQRALMKLIVAEKAPLPIPESDPIAKWVGKVRKGPSTDELMRTTRGEGWEKA